MGRVLLAPETFNLGETSRCVEVGRALKRRGHDVLFLGYSERFADYVRDAGFDLHLAQPRLSDRDADQLLAFDQGRSFRHPFSTDVVRARVASEVALIQSWDAGAVVIGSTFTTLLSARQCRVPVAYVKPYALSRGHLADMVTLPVLGGHGVLAAAVNGGAGSAARHLARHLRWSPRSFARVARERGLPRPRRTVDALRSDLDLIASLPPLIDGRACAPGETFVGPVYARPSDPLPTSVLEIAARPRPVVYVGMGSSARRDLVRAVLEQLGPLDVEVVTSAGRYLDEQVRRRLPGNVAVYDFLPAHRLAGLIDASVVHGGEGTVQTACASGRPFAGIGLQTEQRWNIDECVRLGNALRFTSADVRRRRVGDLVGRMLGDERMRSVAERVAAIGRTVDGPAACAEQVSALLAGVDMGGG